MSGRNGNGAGSGRVHPVLVPAMISHNDAFKVGHIPLLDLDSQIYCAVILDHRGAS